MIDPETVSQTLSVLQAKGSDHWWTGPIEDFTTGNYRRGQDTLDVWFDSGSSWTLVQKLRSTGPLADVCLEGSDQHRGWFQSQLLTCLANDERRIPYRSLLTHGFIMDEKGAKMSKSAGNGLSPSEIINGSEVGAQIANLC